MGQGHILRWTAAALGLLLAGQLLSALAHRTPETVTAVLRDTARETWVEGVVIRRETVISADQPGPWRPVLQEGQEAAAGQTLFTLIPSGETEDAARQDRRAAYSDQARALAPAGRLTALRETVAALSGDNPEPETAERLTALVAPVCSETEEAHPAAGPVLTAPAAGIFTTAVDGLEGVLTPEEPWEDWTLPPKPRDRRELGRLILGERWYFRCTLPEAAPGQTLAAMLPGGTSVRLEVLEVRGNKCLLACDTALAEVADVRSLSVKFPEDGPLGVEIPAKALYTVGEKTGVWCREGDRARFKTVELLFLEGETAVAALDKSTTDNLWPGDQVFLKDPNTGAIP